ncbi:hypothetical protein MYBA111488_24480 [Mycobacterium basiliense]
MQRHQRRRTRRIHRHRRALQPQHISHPTRRDAGQLAGQPEALHRFGREHAVALCHYPGEHTGGAAPQSTRLNSRPLQGLPGQFKKHPLLRIHRQGLAGPHAEESRIEVADAVHEPPGTGVAGTRNIGIQVEQPVQIPATIGRKLGDHVAARRQHVPKVVGRFDPAGVATRHSNNRNGVLTGSTRGRDVLDFLWNTGEFGANVPS